MRWICIASVVLSVQSCCPCDEEPQETETVHVATPEQAAGKLWYADYPDWARVEGWSTEPRTRHLAELHTATEDGPIDDVVDGLFVCRVTVNNKQSWDTFGAPDPACDLKIGDGVLVRTAVSGLSESTVYVGWPKVSLKKGELLVLKVTDIDVARHDFIGAAESTWGGFSHTVFAQENFDADCAVVPADAVADELESEIAFAGEQLEALDKALVPNPDDLAWGYPKSAVNSARWSAISVAGLVGWRDSRAVGVRERFDAAQARWLELVAASIKDEVDGLPPLGTPVPLGPGYELRVLGSVCDNALVRKLTDFNYDHACFIRVHLRNTSDAAVRWRLVASPFEGVFLVLPNGAALEVSAFYAVMPDKTRLTSAPRLDAEPEFVEVPAGATIELGLWNGFNEMPLERSHVLRTPTHRLRLR